MFKKVLYAAVLVLAVSAVSQAADFSKIPTPITKAKVGQWVTYNSMGGIQQKQSIIAIEGAGDDQVVTIKLEMMMNGQVMQSQEQKVGIKEAKDVANSPWSQDPNIKITEAKVSVKGKDVDGVIVEFTQAGATSKLYLSNAVPIHGIVKMEVTGAPAPIMELVDFGG